MGPRRRLALARTDVRYYGRRHHRWLALARCLFAVLALGYEGERCQECGQGYGRTCWWAPQPLWDEIVGRYGGLLCPGCFTAGCDRLGIGVHWTPMVVARGGVPTTNHWLDETRDALMMGEPDPGYFPGKKVRQPQPTWARVAGAYPTDAPSPYPAENRVPSPEAES